MHKIANNLFFLLPIALFSVGFVTLLSTSPERAKTQAIYFVIGYILFVFFSFFDISILEYFHKHIYTLGLVLLIITHFVAEPRLGASRWLSIAGIAFQASEFAKLSLAISLSAFLANNLAKLNELKTLLFLAVGILPYVVLVYVQPDLGTALVLVFMSAILVFYAGLPKLYFVLGLIGMGILSNPIWHALKDYQKQRILVFINPQLDVLGSGYNVIQAIIAVGSGGFWGKGFRRGTQSNLEFLPAHWTDFVFASFAEEWGFVGAVLLICVFLLLLVLILFRANTTKSTFESFLGIGIFAMFFFQFTINIGMNVGIMPVSGITLPLISYGGSSMIASLVMLGMVNGSARKHMLY
ncbi:rod shape-determining protein RodA [Patescibacteria group bacterium]|nr:rod shape-determining protein RodA [Patescibacteria group bacterium]